MPRNAAETQESENDFEEFEESGEDLGQSAETKLQPFPAGVYRALILVTLIGAGSLISNAATISGTPDERGPEEVARACISYRSKMNPEKVGPITDQRVNNLANLTTCVKNKLGYPTESKHVDGDSFICQGGNGQPMKYVYQINTRTYIWDKLFQRTVDAINQQKAGENTKGTMEWFTWENPTEFLAQPLACVRDKDDSCIHAWDGTDCQLLAPVAKAASQANREMAEAGKGQLDPIVCFRSDVHQITAWVAGSPSEIGNRFPSGDYCPMGGSSPGRAFPGNNLHGMGLALDLANQKEAKEYLAKVGIACSPTPFEIIEEGHCAFGDKFLSQYLKSAKGQSR